MCQCIYLFYGTKKNPFKIEEKSDLEASIPTYFKKNFIFTPTLSFKRWSEKVVTTLENPLIEVFLNYILLEKVMKY